MPYDTFVQSQIDQHTHLSRPFRVDDLSGPRSDTPNLQKPLQEATLWVSRRLRLVQFILAHATASHTTERVFALLGDDRLRRPQAIVATTGGDTPARPSKQQAALQGRLRREAAALGSRVVKRVIKSR
jgi:hypothetical protein